MKIQILEQGYCICKVEPQGHGGMEGYVRGEQYKYEMVIRCESKYYFRVYLQETFPDYYETCGPGEFAQHFRKVQ